jgi:hypothetical protein
MEPIVNIDLSLKELGECGRPGGMAAFRRSGIALYWTLLPGLDAYALNGFAPLDHAFWNFSAYQRLRQTEEQFCSQATRDERHAEVVRALTRLSRQAGHNKRSGFAHGVFGSWGAGLGEFNPPNDEMGFIHMWDRRISMVMPTADREAVQAHFEAQADRFGESSVIHYPERCLRHNIGDLENTDHYQLLNGDIARKNPDERAWLYEQARQLDNAQSISALTDELDIRFALRAMFALSRVWPSFAPFVDMDRYAGVLRFRAKVALAACPLPQIERLAFQIRFFSELDARLGENPADIFEELVAMLESHLEPYRPLIDFELPSQSHPAGTLSATRSTTSSDGAPPCT